MRDAGPASHLQLVVAASIDRHLAGCPHCTEYLAQIQRTIEITGRSGLDDDAAIPADVLDALQRAFDEFQAEGSNG